MRRKGSIAQTNLLSIKQKFLRIRLTHFSIVSHRACYGAVVVAAADAGGAIIPNGADRIETTAWLDRVYQQYHDDLCAVYAWLAEVPCLT